MKRVKERETKKYRKKRRKEKIETVLRRSLSWFGYVSIAEFSSVVVRSFQRAS